jgi:hypothetical protein
MCTDSGSTEGNNTAWSVQRVLTSSACLIRLVPVEHVGRAIGLGLCPESRVCPRSRTKGVGKEGQTCQKERGFRGPGFRSAKLTECLALPDRQSASAMVVTKPNRTRWSIKKEVLASARTTQNKQPSHTQYNQPIATPLFPPNPQCSVSDRNSSDRTGGLMEKRQGELLFKNGGGVKAFYARYLGPWIAGYPKHTVFSN